MGIFRAMKIFQKIIVIFHEIDPPRPRLKSFFNLRNVVKLLFYVQWPFTSLVFILTEGDSLREYTTSFYIWATAIGSFNNYIEVIRNMSNIFKLIDDFENAIKKREFIWKWRKNWLKKREIFFTKKMCWKKCILQRENFDFFYRLKKSRIKINLWKNQ